MPRTATTPSVQPVTVLDLAGRPGALLLPVLARGRDRRARPARGVAGSRQPGTPWVARTWSRTQPTISPVVAPGREDLGDPHRLELGHVGAGDDAAAEHRDVGRVALAQQLEHLGEQRHVRAGEHGQPDGVGVFLDGRLDDLLGRLVQPGVDDLDAGVTQRSRDDLGAAVVPVEAGLGDHDADRADGCHHGCAA